MRTFILKNTYTARILACGSQLKNTFCLAHADRAYLSEPVGDLEDCADYAEYEKAIEASQNEIGIKPTVIAYDLHPEYLSTKYARALPIKKKVGVQHHHAHIASCMVEHGIDEKVIGVAFDGLGYGTDGHWWGGEFLVADYSSYQRAAHLRYVPMPGGTAAIREPWRMALAYLYEMCGDSLFDLKIDFVAGLRKRCAEMVVEMLQKKISTPLTSSMGRLFDGVSALTGVTEVFSREGSAAIDLERYADPNVSDAYAFDIVSDSMPWTIDWQPVIQAILSDLEGKVPPAVISAKFHNAVGDMVTQVCLLLKKRYHIDTVVLAGGVFQNTYLTDRVRADLRKYKCNVYIHNVLPSNDSAISLGQAVIALSQ